jgi:hypothetical protein
MRRVARATGTERLQHKDIREAALAAGIEASDQLARKCGRAYLIPCGEKNLGIPERS